MIHDTWFALENFSLLLSPLRSNRTHPRLSGPRLAPICSTSSIIFDFSAQKSSIKLLLSRNSKSVGKFQIYFSFSVEYSLRRRNRSETLLTAAGNTSARHRITALAAHQKTSTVSHDEGQRISDASLGTFISRSCSSNPNNQRTHSRENISRIRQRTSKRHSSFSSNDTAYWPDVLPRGPVELHDNFFSTVRQWQLEHCFSVCGGTICQPFGLTDYITIEYEPTANNGHADDGRTGRDSDRSGRRSFGLRNTPNLVLLLTALAAGVSWGILG